MEYGKFGNIKSFMENLLKKDYISEFLLCFISYQILNGLKNCHKNKIYHFYIKPDNIVIDEYLKAKIIDFSISIDCNKTNKNQIKTPFRGLIFIWLQKLLNRR